MTSTRPSIDASDRVVVVGIGSSLRGDDAIGLELVRRVDDTQGRVLVVEGGVAPENSTGVVRRFEPDWIVLVDAVAFGAEPGTGKWVDPDDLGGESFSSHKSTPAMLRTFLERETGADVALFGVQPATTEIDEELSAAVEQRLEDLAAELTATIDCEQPE